MDLNYVELLREVGACFSVNNMLRAECYKQRMEKGLSFLEFNYMIMQSYDFYQFCSSTQMQHGVQGGDDQWSNMLGGTEAIRRKLRQGCPRHGSTITLLLNSEGKKMGKTAKGAVWLDPNKTSPFASSYRCYWQRVTEDVLMPAYAQPFHWSRSTRCTSEGARPNQPRRSWLPLELTKLSGHGERREAQKAQDAAKDSVRPGRRQSDAYLTTLTPAMDGRATRGAGADVQVRPGALQEGGSPPGGAGRGGVGRSEGHRCGRSRDRRTALRRGYNAQKGKKGLPPCGAR